MNSQLTVLQLVRLRGRPELDDLADAAGLPSSAVESLVAELLDTGQLAEARGRLRVTPDGKAALARLIADERATLDSRRLTECYERFSRLNVEFKQLVTDWQLIGGVPNEHTDSAYDASIIERLGRLHDRFLPLLTELEDVAPRLGVYPGRLASALEKTRAGDHSWLARPLKDSYHTAWFELHEDLIGLLGLTRLEEAAAGRAE